MRSIPAAIRAHPRPGRHGLLVCALISSGCAASATSWRGPSPATRVEVFYATDRKALSSNSFAGDRGSGALSFGISPVLLPARTIGLGIPLSQEKFEQSLSSALTRTGAKDILVFVHGYNFSFDEAVLWAGQLKHQLHFEGAVVLYSWPSSGNRWSYLGDSSNADWTTPHLAGFLQALAARTGRAQIHLLAHSLGSRPVVAALHSLAVGPHAARFGQIIFAAPDVDADAFRDVLPAIVATAERITLYTASDLALRVSALLSAHPRAGDSDRNVVLIDGMDTIDVTSADEGPIRHDYFLENERVLADIFQLLSYAAPPEKRFRLFAVRVRGRLLWQFRS